VLRHRDRDLVPLADELAFVDRYARLVRLRWPDAFALEVEADGDWLVPPVAVQSLVENAVEHNVFGRRRPLVVRVRVDGDALAVDHEHRPRPDAGGPGTGLRTLSERVRLVTGRELTVSAGDRFVVRVPLVRG
jgi:LytS/YehU family sensor histidine kinase